MFSECSLIEDRLSNSKTNQNFLKKNCSEGAIVIRKTFQKFYLHFFVFLLKNRHPELSSRNKPNDVFRKSVDIFSIFNNFQLSISFQKLYLQYFIVDNLLFTNVKIKDI